MSKFYDKEMEWYESDLDQAKELMLYVFDNYKNIINSEELISCEKIH